MRVAVVTALLIALSFSRTLSADCPVERAPVKSGVDAQAAQISLAPLPVTIESLHAMPVPPRPLPHDSRIAPVEKTIYSVVATLMAYRLTPAGEIQLVLSDDERRTILATIPSVQCAAGSRFLSEITTARSSFERRYPTQVETFTEVRRAVEVRGVGFFDYFQGQRGLAPNGLSLYPVTYLSFVPFPPPKAPPLAGRRRSVGAVRPCTLPSLSITASRGSACAGESVTIAWSASHPSASVTIDGIGAGLPATGIRTITTNAATIYSGRATTSCGASNEALALVTVTSGATASLTGPSSIQSGRTGTLSVLISAASSWTLSSFLRNSIAPSTGTASGTATYSANRTGTDTVTLTTTGGVCGNLMRTLTITISEPPSTGGIRCCDGTHSPTCTSCTQGCCSGHGGCKSCQ
ncbi:MAG TPA: hypothetical protein VGD79_03125 [Thermoanaerobaculia bacterium]